MAVDQNEKQNQEDLRKAMAQQARDILIEDKAPIAADKLDEVADLLIDSFPKAKQYRPDQPDYSFEDFVGEFSAKLTGHVSAALLRNTRGAIADRRQPQ